jgi:regulatory protein
MDSALRMLARRDLSEGEMRERLARREFPPAEIDAVIRRLTDMGLLDDARLCAALARSYREVRRYGPYRIARELKKRRFSPDLVEEAVRGASSPEEELQAARAAVEKKFREGIPPGREGAARAYRFLAGRGFSHDVCRRAIREAGKADLPPEGEE